MPRTSHKSTANLPSLLPPHPHPTPPPPLRKKASISGEGIWHSDNCRLLKKLGYRSPFPSGAKNLQLRKTAGHSREPILLSRTSHDPYYHSELVSPFSSLAPTSDIQPHRQTIFQNPKSKNYAKCKLTEKQNVRAPPHAPPPKQGFCGGDSQSAMPPDCAIFFPDAK